MGRLFIVMSVSIAIGVVPLITSGATILYQVSWPGWEEEGVVKPSGRTCGLVFAIAIQWLTYRVVDNHKHTVSLVYAGNAGWQHCTQQGPAPSNLPR